jgi:WD40 repeat protein
MSSKSAPASDFADGSHLPVVRIFGELRFHTDGEVAALAFNPAGDLFSIEDPGRLRRWETTTGQATFSALLSDLETLWRFGPDARVAISASDEVCVWDVATGKMLRALAQPSWVSAVDLRGNPAILATGYDDGHVRLWDAGSGRQLRELKGHDRTVTCLAFSPDGQRLASAAEDRVICLWDTSTGRQLGNLKQHTDHIEGLAWHQSGKLLISIAWDRTARVWDTTTFEPIILLNTHADQVTALALSDDGELLACADSDHAIHLWNPVAGKELHVLREHLEEVRSLAFSRKGKILASGGVDRVIHLWDPREGKLLSGAGRPVLERSNLAVIANGNRLATSSGGAGLQVWEIVNGKPSLKPNQTPAESLVGSPDGRWLATSGGDHRVHVWNAQSLTLHKVFEGQAGKAGALTFSPDSKRLASVSTSDGMVWIWDVASGEPVLVIPLAADACTVEAIAFNPQGNLLAAAGIDWLETSGSDGALCLWNVAQPGPVATFNRGATALSFHPAGRLLAGATLNESICTWDVESQKAINELSGHSDTVTCVGYSPDGRWLVSGSADRTLRIWNAENGESMASHSLDTPVQAISFSSDGAYLFTANGNTTCYQLEMRTLLEDGRPR